MNLLVYNTENQLHMDYLSKMNKKQLEAHVFRAQKELVRRNNLDDALAEILKVLSKYNLSVDDIDWARTRKPTKKNNRENIRTQNPKKGSQKDQRSQVSSKYLNPNGNEKWSGRGRPPVWVKNICEIEQISVKKFKLDPRFKI